MWWAQPDDHELLVSVSAASVLTAVAAQYWTTSRSCQLGSEAIGWIFLYFLIRYTKRPCLEARASSGNAPLRDEVKSRPGSCWIFSVAIAIATISSEENTFAGFLTPALTPAMGIMQKLLNHQHPTLTTMQHRAWKYTEVAISVLGVYTLVYPSPSPRGLFLSTIELLSLVVLYGVLVPKSDPKTEAMPYVNIEADIATLAPKVVGVLMMMLALQTLLLGFGSFDPLTTLLAGTAKALTWLFVMDMARQISWSAAAIAKIFAIFSTCNPFIQSRESQAFSHVVVSSLTLGQLVAIIPKRTYQRSFLWVFVTIPLLPYLASFLAIRTAQSRAEAFTSIHEHPVEAIIRIANAEFDDLLRRQSKTYTDAREEYRRRYEADPPPGFEGWFQYAKSHDSPVIDEFDAMYRSLIPLWSLSGQQISDAIRNVQLSPDNELWVCKFSGQTGLTDCAHNWRSFDRHFSKLFIQLVGHVKGVLPDVEFLVNHLDEPRVIFPTGQDQSESKSTPKLTSLSHTPTWDFLVQYCNNTRRDTAAIPKPGVDSYGLSFVQDMDDSRDICNHPSYRQMHGLLTSPTSFRLIEGMVPVLSTGSLSTMGDILFPSPAYFESEFVYSEARDPDWSSKKNILYWAGSTSGAFAKDSSWKYFHRQRFVSLVQTLDGQKHMYLADKKGTSQRVLSSFLNGRLFDVAFTKINQCVKNACREQSTFYRMKEWTDKDEPLRCRLAFDLDGNGISGRWYKLVASKSVPLKQTLLHEWHDDRLLPWVHFIPVSPGMDELPELVTYLTSTKEGQIMALQIADQGREWFSRAMRDADMSIYLYRLLLELARLQDPSRPGFSKANVP